MKLRLPKPWVALSIMAVLLSASSFGAGMTARYVYPTSQWLPQAYLKLHQGPTWDYCHTTLVSTCWLLSFVNPVSFASINISADMLTVDGVGFGGYKTDGVNWQLSTALVNFTKWGRTTPVDYIMLDYRLTTSATTTVVTNVTASELVSLTVDGNAATDHVSRQTYTAGHSLWQYNYTYPTYSTHHFVWILAQVQPTQVINGVPALQFVQNAMLVVGTIVLLSLGLIGAWWLRGRRRGGV